MSSANHECLIYYSRFSFPRTMTYTKIGTKHWSHCPRNLFTVHVFAIVLGLHTQIPVLYAYISFILQSIARNSKIPLRASAGNCNVFNIPNTSFTWHINYCLLKNEPAYNCGTLHGTHFLNVSDIFYSISPITELVTKLWRSPTPRLFKKIFISSHLRYWSHCQLHSSRKVHNILQNPNFDLKLLSNHIMSTMQLLEIAVIVVRKNCNKCNIQLIAWIRHLTSLQEVVYYCSQDSFILMNNPIC